MILSVSQVESFDHDQSGGCNRRWWFERVQGLRPDQTEGQSDGEAGHALLAHYFRTGEAPKGRVKMGKAVTGAIVKGELPAPGSDLRVEERFDGQPQRDAAGAWLPVDPRATLWLGGVPWDGFIDLRFRRSDVVDVLDHKFTSDLSNAKPADALIRTVQMPVYALASLKVWPTATRFRLAHHYVSRRGVESLIRSQVVTLDRVLERKAAIEITVAAMKATATAKTQDEVPFNRRACSAWNGCPHQSICSAFKEKKLNLTPEELAMFSDLDTVAAPAYTPSPEEVADVRAKWADETPAPIATTSGVIVPVPAAALSAALEALVPTTTTAEIPAPVATPTPPAPACTDCGAALNAENGSCLRSGQWVHVGCPKAVQIPDSMQTIVPPPKKRGRPAKPAPEPVSLEKAIEVMTTAAESVAAPLGPEAAAIVGEVLRLAASAEPTVSATPAPIQGATSSTVTVRFEFDPRALDLLAQLLGGKR